MLHEVYDAVAGGFGTNKAAAPVFTFSSQDTHKLVSEFLVGAEEETNLPSASSNIPCGYIRVLPDVLLQLTHKGDTETPNLIV